MWSRSGRELFYESTGADSKFMTVTVSAPAAVAAPSFGKPRALFSFEGYDSGALRDYDISLDDQRFLMVKPLPGTGQPRNFIVVSHWLDDVRARMNEK